MEIKNIFNRKEFVELLFLAKGRRSLTQYSKEAGVSVAHLSRLTRAIPILDSPPSPPSPATLYKLAQYADNNVTYKDLMIAAGYVHSLSDSDNKVSRHSIAGLKNEQKALEGQYMKTIIDLLSKLEIEWQIKNQKTENSLDLVVDVEDEKYKKWIFKFITNVNQELTEETFLQLLYGELAMKYFKKADKVHIVVNSSVLYKLITENPPQSLNGDIYLMLVDANEGFVKKEERINDYKFLVSQ